jgi:hypothetical protein
MLPRIVMADGELGFHWASPTGEPMSLAEVVRLPDAEPDRWLPTHLEALDDVLIEVAGRFGEVLGGGRGVAPEEREALATAYVVIDRACREYADAHAGCDLPDDLRAGQITGTAALMSVRARSALGLMGAAPFDGELDTPAPGTVGGTCDLTWVDADEPWRGARWIVTTETGRRLPATLAMMLYDSSGVNKEASLDEHRAALARVTDAVPTAPDPFAAAGAVDWLLFDWVMAHRESADSGAVEVKSGRVSDARMIVLAVAASVEVRARVDPALMSTALRPGGAR